MAYYTHIAGILIDFSTEIPRSKSFDVTTEAVQSSDFSDIARHIRNIMPRFSLNCSLIGDDREERFVQLLEISEKKNTISIEQSEIIDNIVITNITETGKWENTVSFDIEFQTVNSVTFEAIPEIKLTRKQTLQNTTKTGLHTTKELEAEQAWLKQ